MREWTEELTRLYEQKEDPATQGEDTSTIDTKILDMSRKIRAGGRLKPGDLLTGRYKLIGVLGNGGFATVWKVG